MKKILILLTLAVSIFTVTACATDSNMGQGQGGGQNMGGDMPPRFEKISEADFYAGLNLDSAVKAKLEVILADFKVTLEEKLKGSQMPPSREVMEPLIKARDTKVEPLLTSSQYETYKKTVEGLFVPDHNQRPGA